MNLLVLNLQKNPTYVGFVREKILKFYPEVVFFDIIDKASLESSPNYYWNSILIVLFDKDAGRVSTMSEVYETYMQTSDNRGHVIPISCDNTASLPTPMERIKSIPIDGAENENIFLMRLGSFLGLRWIPKDSDIFISYKVSDGKSIAIQVKEILQAENFNVWLDEDRDDDNEGNIKVGEDCQVVINKAVGNSSLMLLIDTPEAHKSKWVNAEIEYANGSLVPILPLVFRSDYEKGPSFRSLLELQRWVDFPYKSNSSFKFSEDQKSKLCEYVHRYLLDFHNRKKLLPGKISTRFAESKFLKRADEGLEKRLCFIFDRKSKWSLTVFTHAFCYPAFFRTAVQVFSTYLSQLSHSPHHYFIIYDGLVWSEPEIATVKSIIGKDNLRIIHLGELVESIEGA